MRVQLRSGRDSERGAVAVVVGLLMIPLMVIAAFGLDFGNAFAQRRALSSGADSAALSIVGQQQQIGVANPSKTCSQLVADDAALPANSPSKATNVALNYINANAPFGATLSASDITVSLSCTTTGTPALLATVTVRKLVPTSLGKLVGVNNLNVDRTAQAAMGVASKVTGFRPIGLCQYQAQDILAHAAQDAANGVPYRGELISLTKIWTGNNMCGSAGSGNWGWLDCGQGNGASALGAVLSTGCPGAITLDTSTTPPSYVINGSPGNSANNTPVHTGMDTITDDVVDLPVYSTFTGTGNNLQFRVVAFLSVKICGYDVTTRGACYDPAVPMSGNDIQVRYAAYRPVGQLGGTCQIGDPCAYNTLVTKLVG